MLDGWLVAFEEKEVITLVRLSSESFPEVEVNDDKARSTPDTNTTPTYYCLLLFTTATTTSTIILVFLL